MTEPPYVPVWRLAVINFAKVMGWLLLTGAGTLALIGAAQIFPEKIFAVFVAFWFVGTPILVFWFIAPELQKASRRFKMELAGRNPTHAVMTARRPPIFYLRSFAFDEASSLPPKWLQRIMTYGASAAAAAPTPEMSFILRLRRYAPVLAIGRPGEFHPPPGAIRFYVSNERWQVTVEAIVPCCALIVWVSGNTQGLRWEIEHLIKRLPPRRLLLWPHVRIMRLSREQRAAEWQRFVDGHSDIFPKPLPRDVRKIRFIGFDADWTPVPVPSSRYPASIMDRLSDITGTTGGLRAFLKDKLR